MTVRLWLRLACLAWAAAAVIPAAANECAKEVYVYVDTSQTMTEVTDGRPGAMSRLQALAAAGRRLLSGTGSLLSDGDRLRIVTFDEKSDALFDDTIGTETRSDVSSVFDQFDRWRNASPRTDLMKIFEDLEAQPRSDRLRFVIIASDMIHDPDNENCQNVPARKRQIVQFIKRFASSRDSNPPRFLLLNARVQEKCRDKIVEDVRIAMKELYADELRFDQDDTNNIVRQLAQKFALPMKVSISVDSLVDSDPDSMSIEVKNPNSFGVKLTRATVDGVPQTEIVDKTIPCGSTEPFAMHVNANSKSIEAVFEGQPTVRETIPSQFLDIEIPEVQYFYSTPRSKGTLLFELTLRKRLTNDTQLNLIVREWGDKQLKVPIEQGTGHQRLAVTASVLPADTDRVKATGLFNITASREGGGALFDREKEAVKDKQLQSPKPPAELVHRFWVIGRILGIFLLAFLRPVRQVFRGILRFLIPTLESDEISDTFRDGCISYVLSLAGNALWFFTPYLGETSKPTWFNLVASAFLLSLVVLLLSWQCALLVWALRIEPRKSGLQSTPPLLGRLKSITWAILTIWGGSFMIILWALFTTISADLSVAAS